MKKNKKKELIIKKPFKTKLTKKDRARLDKLLAEERAKIQDSLEACRASERLTAEDYNVTINVKD